MLNDLNKEEKLKQQTQNILRQQGCVCLTLQMVFVEYFMFTRCNYFNSMTNITSFYPVNKRCTKLKCLFVLFKQSRLADGRRTTHFFARSRSGVVTSPRPFLPQCTSRQNNARARHALSSVFQRWRASPIRWKICCIQKWTKKPSATSWVR